MPANPRLWSAMDDEVGHRRRYTKESLSRLVADAGLRRALFAPMNVWLYPAAAVMRRLNRTGGETPSPRANRILTRVFASEGAVIHRWSSWAGGLSLVYLGVKGS